MLNQTIFFIYPHNLIKNKLYLDLVDKEHEVYFVYDHRLTDKIMARFDDPLIIINPDKNPSRTYWKETLPQIIKDAPPAKGQIAIASLNESDENEWPDYPYIHLGAGLEKGTNQLMRLIESHSEKRKRKHIRVQCEEGEAFFNVKIDGIYEYGEILDISSVGMAVKFSDDLELAKNSFFPDIQLKLKWMLLPASAVVYGYRNDAKGKKIYILLFGKKTSSHTRSRIKLFINKKLHESIEKRLFAQC